MIGYKAAEYDGKRVIITLLIPPDAITNINRSTVTIKETSKHRTNKAFILKIEDEKGKLYNTAKSSYYQDKVLTYKVKENIEEPSFDMDLEKICSSGIHFFLTKRVAELYGLSKIENGFFTKWHYNGVTEYEVMFNDGKEEGLYQSWHYNGMPRERVYYINGKLEGLYEKWYESGRKYFQILYVRGKMQGLYEEWYDTGNRSSRVMYINGVMEGLYERWDSNGQKLYEMVYKDGKVVY